MIPIRTNINQETSEDVAPMRIGCRDLLLETFRLAGKNWRPLVSWTAPPFLFALAVSIGLDRLLDGREIVASDLTPVLISTLLLGWIAAPASIREFRLAVLGSLPQRGYGQELLEWATLRYLLRASLVLLKLLPLLLLGVIIIGIPLFGLLYMQELAPYKSLFTALVGAYRVFIHLFFMLFLSIASSFCLCDIAMGSKGHLSKMRDLTVFLRTPLLKALIILNSPTFLLFGIKEALQDPPRTFHLGWSESLKLTLYFAETSLIFLLMGVAYKKALHLARERARHRETV